MKHIIIVCVVICNSIQSNGNEICESSSDDRNMEAEESKIMMLKSELSGIYVQVIDSELYFTLENENRIGNFHSEYNIYYINAYFAHSDDRQNGSQYSINLWRA